MVLLAQQACQSYMHVKAHTDALENKDASIFCILTSSVRTDGLILLSGFQIQGNDICPSFPLVFSLAVCLS